MCFQNAFPDAVRLRSTFQSPPLLKIAELALDEAEQERQKTHKGQIEHAGIEQRPGDALGLHKSFTGHGDLNDGDGPGQRGVLHQRDDLIGHGGDDPLDHLQKGDLEENLPKGVLYAVIACIVGAAAWGLISVSTGYQIGYMAIGIGFLVGFAMRQGKGIRPVFGIIGATLALLSCVLGDFFSIIGYIAKDYDMSYTDVLFGADYAEIFSLMTENLASMTILFYGFAVYEGYKFSFRAQKHPEGGKI